MKQRVNSGRAAGICLLAVALVGCTSQPAPSSVSSPAQQALPAESQSATAGQSRQTSYANMTDWVPPLFTSPEEEAAYYVSRLSDRRFVSGYGGSDNSRTWYIAAERLGEIGMPAVPLLFARLNTEDEYELMLALYALQLATQDPLLMVQTRGDYIQLATVLDPSSNTENQLIAREWWQQYSALLNAY